MTALLPLAAPPPMTLLLAGAALALLLVVSTLLVARFRYVRCPPNHVLVIYGHRQGEEGARIRHGGARFVYPVIHGYELLSLEPVELDLPIRDLCTRDGIAIEVDLWCLVALSSHADRLSAAGRHLPRGSGPASWKRLAEPLIAAAARLVFRSLTLAEIRQNIDFLLHTLHQNIEERLGRLGLSVFVLDPEVRTAVVRAEGVPGAPVGHVGRLITAIGQPLGRVEVAGEGPPRRYPAVSDGPAIDDDTPVQVTRTETVLYVDRE